MVSFSHQVSCHNSIHLFILLLQSGNLHGGIENLKNQDLNSQKTEHQHNKLIMNYEVIIDIMWKIKWMTDMEPCMRGNGELKTLQKNQNNKEHCPKWNENMLRKNGINSGLKPNRRRRKSEVGVSILNLEKLEVSAYISYFCL